MEFTTIKGFRDVLPGEVETWQFLEATARRVFRVFGFREIKTPLLERTDLFSRGIGEETDIVSKEMYSLKDSKGRGMTLRPEATASVVRAYVEHRLFEAQAVQKLFLVGPMFRHERPQKGRFRQFHQYNAELYGDAGPGSDADILLMARMFFEEAGVEGLSLRLNSLGCPVCRPGFRALLKDYLATRGQGLCEVCRRRTETNPLRVFDCKLDPCRAVMGDAPSVLDSLCEACLRHLDGLREALDRLQVPYTMDHRLVRGLDYYNRTTFEIQTDRLGAQNAVAGGGRYDGLVALLGGPETPAVGFAVGVERVVALLEGQGRPPAKGPDLFVAALGHEAERACLDVIQALRKAGLCVERDYGARGLKAQLKRADRLGAEKVLIVGDGELVSKRALLRDMRTKGQEEIPFGDPAHILGRLRGC